MKKKKKDRYARGKELLRRREPAPPALPGQLPELLPERLPGQLPKPLPGQLPEQLPEGVQVVRLYNYQISFEPMEDPQIAALPPEARERIERTAELLQERPRKALAELERLVKEFPHLPPLHNHLTIARRDAGDHAGAIRLIRETYERFPDYLFGMTNYALLRLQDGHPEEVPEILRHAPDLPALFPGREVFHVSEYAAFHSTVAEYHLAIGEEEQARQRYESLLEICPEHPLVVRLGTLLEPPPPVRAGPALLPPPPVLRWTMPRKKKG
jgi:tetratricopeptide (TPR) repeat protein